MLACGIAAATSKQLTYGSIYTTKLLRRGIDIEQPKATSTLATLNVAEVMQPFTDYGGPARVPASAEIESGVSHEMLAMLVGPVNDVRDPQVLFGDEDLEHALRQLVLYGHDGLPVLSHDEHTLEGWVTREDVLRTLLERAHASARDIERGAEAAEFAVKDPHKQVHLPSTPLAGYEILEITVSAQAPACRSRLSEVRWPAGSIVIAASEGRKLVTPRADIELQAGGRIVLLAPAAASAEHFQQQTVVLRR
jgi:chloride channel protein, CIC family